VIGIVAGVVAIGVAVAAAYYLLGRSSRDSKEPDDAIVSDLGVASGKAGKRNGKSESSTSSHDVQNTEEGGRPGEAAIV